MALTVGSGPFGRWPAGSFNVSAPEPEEVLWFEDSPRWVRGRRGGETVVDSRHAKLLHEHGSLPVYYFPEDDVRTDLLEPAGDGEGSPRRGPERRFDVLGAERAAWTHPEPPPGAEFLRGHVAFEWTAMEEWLEEEEVLAVHPRDPYHRVDVLPSSRHVRILAGGTVLADSRRTLALFETGLPPRWYVPREDVRMDLLEPSDLRTQCPYKGEASYLSAPSERDIAWTYEHPRDEVAPIAGLVAFWNERADVELDGEIQEPPRTQWSEGG